MKIAISSMGKDLNSMLDVRFGRCSYFIIYDTERGLEKVIENRAQVSAAGAGTAAAQEILNEDVDAVITGNMGPNAFMLFKNSGIKVYRSGSIEVEKAVQLLEEGKLDELTEAGPARSGMGMGTGRGFRGGR
ncbi:MAG: NifB/NifX family molybdenum-iron cluster-binding protein [Caldicoprobacterales bacterium]|nr:diguanylate cyclase [Clostridiales bacterium]